MWELISHHFCRLLFVREKSINPVYSQGVGNIQEHEDQEAGIIGSHLTGCLQLPPNKVMTYVYSSSWVEWSVYLKLASGLEGKRLFPPLLTACPPLSLCPSAAWGPSVQFPRWESLPHFRFKYGQWALCFFWSKISISFHAIPKTMRCLIRNTFCFLPHTSAYSPSSSYPLLLFFILSIIFLKFIIVGKDKCYLF